MARDNRQPQSTPAPTPAPTNSPEELQQEKIDNQPPAGDTGEINDLSGGGTEENVSQKAEETTPAATDAPAPTEPPVQEQPAAVEVKEESQGNLIEVALTKVDSMAQLQLHALQEYMVAMQPRKPVSEQEIQRQQVKLYNTILNVINHTGDDFPVAYSTFQRLFDPVV
jgi:flagellar biosynthesis GTPase FlhF